jgi:transposase
VDRKIVEYLVMGKSHRDIKRELHVGGGRLAKVLALAEAQGYLSGRALPVYPEALFPDRADGRGEQSSRNDELLLPRLQWIKERLAAGWKAVTVFEELGVSVTRSSFYRFLARQGLDEVSREARTARVVPEIVHAPGEALILDWGKLCVGVDDGVRKTLWVLIAVLGYSRYLCARVVWSNDVATTLSAIESIWQELGGVTVKLTSDNPKCFAITACRYEPVLHPSLLRFAGHYDFVVECLPPRAPTLKGKVERMVPYVRRLYEAHGEFISLTESQQYLNHKLAIANQRTHGSTRKRPVDDLLIERAALKPLPPLAYEIEEHVSAIVRADGHVRFANRYYSVDERHVGKETLILGTRTVVSIYIQGALIETHARLTDPYRTKQTKPQHLKPWERALGAQSMYRTAARQLGPAVERMIVLIIERGHGFIDTRQVWGLLSLDKTFTGAEIDAACARALDINRVGYRAVLPFLPRTARTTKTRQRAIRNADNDAAQPKGNFKANRHTRDLAIYTQHVRDPHATVAHAHGVESGPQLSLLNHPETT